jgi:hypothetical protein
MQVFYEIRAVIDRAYNFLFEFANHPSARLRNGTFFFNSPLASPRNRR